MSEQNGIKTGFSKWLALPITAKLIKYGLKIFIILGLAVLAGTGADTMNSALDEMTPLIESGALPQCVRDLPIGICMILLSGIMILMFSRKK